MSNQALANLLHNILSGHADPVSAIVESECRRGRTVIRPGDVDWLPERDWMPGTVCSVACRSVRLVLLHARHPGSGAMTRTLAMLSMAQLMPAIIDPTPELAATLSRHRWRGRVHGRSFETRETVWKPHRDPRG